MGSIEEVNSLDQEHFVARFGRIFEHSPWVAERSWHRRPFATPARLHEAMAVEVRTAGQERQLALIRAHPDLAGRAALAGSLTADSSKEQASAGLDRLNEADFARFHALNEAYRAKFGFPFVMAVRAAGKDAILAAFERRLANLPEREIDTAIEEIVNIGWLRLSELVGS